MSFQPSSSDYKALESFLERALDTYKNGTHKRKVIGILAHAVTLATLDNSVEFKRLIRQTDEDLYEF
jgi:hypothetical protein